MAGRQGTSARSFGHLRKEYGLLAGDPTTTRRLHERALARLLSERKVAGELVLAFFVTAGVTHCGGPTLTSPSPDAGGC